MRSNETKSGNTAIFLFCLLSLFLPAAAEAQASPGGLRSLDRLFPGLGDGIKKEVLSETGYIHSLDRNETLKLIPAPDSGIELRDAVMESKPSFLAESLLVLPYNGRILDRLDAYNAAGRVRDLKGRLYHSFTRQAEIPLFEDATRIKSAAENSKIPDPPSAKELPSAETVYLRLKDVNFGHTYYRGDISTNVYGVTYNLTNFKRLSYLFFTVMKEERFRAILYMEPLAEGMLVYSVAGADASDFIASKISIPSAIEKRLAVFIGWISDGIKAAGQ